MNKKILGILMVCFMVTAMFPVAQAITQTELKEISDDIDEKTIENIIGDEPAPANGKRTFVFGSTKLFMPVGKYTLCRAGRLVYITTGDGERSFGVIKHKFVVFQDNSFVGIKKGGTFSRGFVCGAFDGEPIYRHIDLGTILTWLRGRDNGNGNNGE